MKTWWPWYRKEQVPSLFEGCGAPGAAAISRECRVSTLRLLLSTNTSAIAVRVAA